MARGGGLQAGEHLKDEGVRRRREYGGEKRGKTVTTNDEKRGKTVNWYCPVLSIHGERDANHWRCMCGMRGNRVHMHQAFSRSLFVCMTTMRHDQDMEDKEWREKALTDQGNSLVW